LVKDLEAVVKRRTINAYLNLNEKRRIENDYLIHEGVFGVLANQILFSKKGSYE